MILLWPELAFADAHFPQHFPQFHGRHGRAELPCFHNILFTIAGIITAELTTQSFIFRQL
ncbi:MAG TPA: hypothetical protein VMH31_14000 [Methylomirabilota bacterium]|nr:hypothetical protein [Methylomirabilota bacterium]